MNIETMTQQERDQLLASFIKKDAADKRAAEYQKMGLSRSKNGFIVVRQGRTEEKGLPALYIAPQFIGRLGALIPVVEQFVQDTAQ